MDGVAVDAEAVGDPGGGEIGGPCGEASNNVVSRSSFACGAMGGVFLFRSTLLDPAAAGRTGDIAFRRRFKELNDNLTMRTSNLHGSHSR